MLLFLLGFLATTADAGASHRKAGSTGIGIGGGTASAGISAKHFMSDSMALQGVVGTYGRWQDGSGLGLSVDYLLEQPTFASADVVDLAWNVGVGAGLGIGDSALGLGVSGVAGLEFALAPIPLDFVIEYRPTLGLSPFLYLDLVNFSGHLRYFF